MWIRSPGRWTAGNMLIHPHCRIHGCLALARTAVGPAVLCQGVIPLLHMRKLRPKSISLVLKVMQPIGDEAEFRQVCWLPRCYDALISSEKLESRGEETCSKPSCELAEDEYHRMTWLGLLRWERAPFGFARCSMKCLFVSICYVFENWQAFW